MNQPTAPHKYAKVLVPLVLAGALLFNAIFWKEKLALNLVLFIAFAIAAMVVLYRSKLKNRYVVLLLLATACSLAMVVIYNSAISSIACISALLLLTAYVKYQHRSPVYAMGSALQSFISFVPGLYTYLKSYSFSKTKGKTLFNKLRLGILPLLLLLGFLLLYRQSSKVFSDLISGFINWLSAWLQPVMNWANPQRLLFLLLGLIITGGLLYRHIQSYFQQAEKNKSDALQRKKLRRLISNTNLWQDLMQLFIGRHASGLLALKYEYKAGTLSLGVLNILLAIVNTTDLVYLWIGQQHDPGFRWAEYVHEGAEMLVLSIVLAMLVVLFFFRGNLNFFKGKKALLLVAYVWLLQNAFLAASVCLRNYYYITHMALTYKRIGVYVFVLLVLAGLVSVYLKIRYVKSSYYLIKWNAIAGFTVLILSAFVQWDILIAAYNLDSRNKIPLDAAFLLTLSDHALPILQQHKGLFSHLEMQSSRGDYTEDINGKPIIILDYRIRKFLEEQQKYTWLSWNLADAKTRQQLQQTPPLATNK